LPYKLKKNKDGTYDVDSPTKKHASHTTKEKAQAQKRLLDAVEHGFVPDAAKKKKKKVVKKVKASRSQY
jgi:hypothetical protein